MATSLGEETVPSSVGGARQRPSGRMWTRTLTSLLGWFVMLLLPSVLTVLRYTADRLNADGVQQSTMSIQGVRLFYWGQDRLLPVVSILASPISDPDLNLWTCLVLQALSFYGLLLFVSHRVVAALGAGVRWATPTTYLVMVASANCVLSPQMLHSFAIEGQPYALSWLLAGLAYEAWKSPRRWWMAVAAILLLVAIGMNPSAVLIAAFLAATDVLRERRIARWVVFLLVCAVSFVVWSYLAGRFAMYPTPDRDPSPSYLDFSLDRFTTGFPTALSNLVANIRPLRTVVVALLATGALVLLPSPTRSRLTAYGSCFAAFSLLFVVVFAGNSWVQLNGYHYRYFFPVALFLVMAVALPIACLLLEAPGWVASRSRAAPSIPHVRGVLQVAAGVVAAATLAGSVQVPQDTQVLEGSQRTARYAETHQIQFVSGAYWNMWPLMFELLDQGRDGVFVAGFKAEGDRDELRARLDQQLSATGRAEALCINDTTESCAAFLDYWTRPGWRDRPRRVTCPAPPIYGPATPEAPQTAVCRVMRFAGDSRAS